MSNSNFRFGVLINSNILTFHKRIISISNGFRLTKVASSIIVATGLLGATPVMALTPEVNNTTVTGEIIYKGDVQNVNEGGVANNSNIYYSPALSGGGIQNVNNGGTTNNAVIYALGTQNVNDGGSSNSTTIDGGTQNLNQGGRTNGTGIAFGTQNINNGGLSLNTRIGNIGVVNVNDGGIANGTSILTTGARMFVKDGGIANDTTINLGNQYVNNGGIANNTIINGNAPSDRGYQYLYQGAIANGTIINSNGQQRVQGGTANDTTINENGYQEISAGGIANNTIINGITWTSSAGMQRVAGGVANDTLLNEMGFQQITENGTANNTTINDNGRQQLYAGTSNGTIINDNGLLSINKGSTANNTTINGDGQIWVGEQYGDEPGGPVATANTTTVNENGQLLIRGNGVLTGETIFNDQGTITLLDYPYLPLQNSGSLVFQRSSDYALDFNLGGTGGLTLNSQTLTLNTVSDYTGATHVNGGRLVLGVEDSIANSSQVNVGVAGTLDLNDINQTVTNLSNAGQVNFGQDTQSILTVSGDYVGQGGTLNMNTVLGDDSSQTNQMVVEGNTSGNSYVSITNAGGHGDQVINGIEIIKVLGLSTGHFEQQGRIVAGTYEYSLVRGTGVNAKNWYLGHWVSPVSPVNPKVDPVDPVTPVDPVDPVVDPTPAKREVQPVYRPEVSGYTNNLAAANNMFVTRLHDRMGETQYVDAVTGEHKVTSMWLRNEGGHNRSRDTYEQLRTLANRYVLQLGGDIAQWSHNGTDGLHLGLMAGYANSKSRTESRVTGYTARASVSGYSTGVYGTWYANEADKSGLYVDSWLQYSWFNNSVDGLDLATEEYKSKGATASVESGYAFEFGKNAAKSVVYFIQPKAQLVWMGVKADDHKESNGTHVSGEGNGNIQTRLGVRASLRSYSDQDKSKAPVFEPFVEANWVHNTKDFGAKLDNISVKQNGAANIAELKVGLESQVNKNVNLWGNVNQQVGNHGYSDTAFMLGAKYSF
ncbi:type V secretion protein A [Serratia sp. S1B]|nr:type V secretion protein A [Serratia sp. S1B]